MTDRDRLTAIRHQIDQAKRLLRTQQEDGINVHTLVAHAEWMLDQLDGKDRP